MVAAALVEKKRRMQHWNQKRSIEKTKVVLRHLPPSISDSALMEQIDGKFAGRQKNQCHARAYLDFKGPNDVSEFAEFFDGHVFVNEKDPEYLEFLELLAKPVENLPSAEIQLERREAERAGVAKEAPIVTPLMDFVRQKSSEECPQRTSGNGKSNRRAIVSAIASNGTVSGVTIAVETGKKAFLLLKGKEREGSHIQRPEAPGKIIRSILSKKEGHQLFDSQLEQQLNTGNSEKEKRPPRPPISLQTLKEHSIGSMHSTTGTIGKSHVDDKTASNESHASVSINDNKLDKRLRNKDRPDRGVWAPLRRADGSHGHGTNILSTNEMPLGHGVLKLDPSFGARGSESKNVGGRGSHTSLDNGTHRHAGRRAPTHSSKESDGSANATEGSPPKRHCQLCPARETGVGSEVWLCFMILPYP
ncbi:hypothetical protein HPP92_004463 [Vanilla planifolia]|uniref:UPF3 domain-containing protein n=1 Tax=Vanilla planifolia TaxID=51239 RepID=A0A835SA61_VANPL|nr:hypothetical protein HPP92_004463 [Vanilla planifolia]